MVAATTCKPNHIGISYLNFFPCKPNHIGISYLIIFFTVNRTTLVYLILFPSASTERAKVE
jgi:hypothetical protein